MVDVKKEGEKEETDCKGELWKELKRLCWVVSNTVTGCKLLTFLVLL